jgi:hypothetical protein
LCLGTSKGANSLFRNFVVHNHLLQISSLSLFPLNGLKEAPEVASAKPVKVVPLDDFNKHRRAIHEWLREELQQIATFVEVDQDVQALDGVKVLDQLDGRPLQPLSHVGVVRVWDRDEIDTSGSHVGHRGDDVWRFQRDVLDAWPVKEVDVPTFGSVDT